MSAEFEILHEGLTIRYRLTAGRSRAGTVSLRVRRDGQVLVSVPPRVPAAFAHRLVREKADWIAGHLKTVAALPAPPLPEERFEHGTMHALFGQDYPLMLMRHDKARPVVGFDGEAIRIHARDAAPEVLSEALDRWYRQQLSARIAQDLRELAATMPWVDALPAFRLKDMRTRWGSCSGRGNLNFNLHLVKAPPVAIRYVVLHELCHLAEMNHGERFWRLVEERMPAWREHRTWFKTHGHRLMT